ncbi:glycosyltransferase [Pseudanabaena sp. FACHB-2040]|uniref:glycosyltransferase n=1 Tax=Pseudanabaena sp. FACHB-2040 TaxID=2692859 RepID=UPI0016895680|nr:glycosyltransferase [Pseudanabaena sp. FACHB-2040]MBD2256338.1 glycosyltransferase [Pseudanabaena sp. FACHB-2040]
MLYPIKVVDIELSRTIPGFSGLDVYLQLLALVRLHGKPIGYVQAPITAGNCSSETLSRLILEQHGDAIIHQLLVNGLAAPSPPNGLQMEDLLSAPSASYEGPWPLVTVAVCTRDRPADIDLCLEGISRLDYPNLDVLVVDNAPTNSATQDLVKSKYPHVRYCCEPRPGLDWARNRAIYEAKGEFIAYTDDDVVVDPGWVSAIAKHFCENPEVMAITGLIVPYELEAEAQVLFEMCGGFGKGFQQKRFYVKRGNKLPWWFLGTGNCGAGANMAYRRKVFSEIGYFDPALDVGTVTNGGGDQEMFFRVIKEGHPLVYEPNAVVFHRHRRDYARLRYQLSGNGGAYSYMHAGIRRYPDELLSFLKLGIIWFLSWHLRRLIISLIYPARYPRDLILAELQGCFMGLNRYPKAQKAATQVEKDFGPIILPGQESASISEESSHERRTETAVRTVELSQPIPSLNDVVDYPCVRVVILRNNTLLGSVDIFNLHQVVSADRLREAIVEALGFKLLNLAPTPGIYARAGYTSYDTSQIFSTLYEHYCQSSQEDNSEKNEVAWIKQKLVSIIIATCKQVDTLKDFLTQLHHLPTQTELEVIVVANDSTSDLESAIQSDFPNTLVITENSSNSASIYNAGIKASRGDIVLLTNDRVNLSSEWLEALVEPFENADVMAVTGATLPSAVNPLTQELLNRSTFPDWYLKPFCATGNWFESSFYKPSPIEWLGGIPNIAFRSKIFTHPCIQLMDEALGDKDLSAGGAEDTYHLYKILKLGYTVLHEPKAYLWDKNLDNVKLLQQKLYKHGKNHAAFHLKVWLKDGDWRGLIHLLLALPLFHLRQVKEVLLHRKSHKISLVLVEILGNINGVFSTLKTHFLRSEKRSGAVPISSSSHIVNSSAGKS